MAFSTPQRPHARLIPQQARGAYIRDSALHWCDCPHTSTTHASQCAEADKICVFVEQCPGVTCYWWANGGYVCRTIMSKDQLRPTKLISHDGLRWSWVDDDNPPNFSNEALCFRPPQ